MLFSIERAVKYFGDAEMWERLRKRAMKANFSWDASAKKYLKLYAKVLGIKTAARGKRKQKAEGEEAPAETAGAEE